MKASKEILLICYSFPPNPGIGGRRWAKFSKYLAKLGYTIHVLTQPHTQTGSSKWTQDVSHPNIIVHEIPSGYPKLQSGHNIFEKIKNRLTIWYLWAICKGTIYDRSIFWKSRLIPYAQKLLDQTEIQHIIVTGAPFHTFYYVSDLKESHPYIQILLDYRDPWTTSKVYGMQELSERRIAFEKRIECLALQSADIVMSPYDTKELLKQAIKESQSNAYFYNLSHAYDPDDIPNTLSSVESSGEKIRLIYGGTLYLGVDACLKALADALDMMKQTNPELYHRLEFHFYTPEQKFQALFSSSHAEIVHFHLPIPAKEIFQEIAAMDICLLFLSDYNKNFRTTKFYEFLTLRKPFLLLGEKGETARYIEEHSLGHALEQTEINAPSLSRLLPAMASRQNFNHTFEVERFSYPAITDTFSHLLTSNKTTLLSIP